MSVVNLGPLDWRIPIVTEEGRPTQEFQRRWASQISNNSQIGSITLGSGPPTIPNPADGAQYADTSTTPYTMYIASGGSWSLAGSSAGNPTATAGDVAIPGTATTFMRSDAAPAVQKASASQFGIVKVDGTTITETGGVISASGGGGGGGSWKLLNTAGAVITSGVTYDFTVPTASINIINLASYNELLVEVTDVAMTSTGVRAVRCSVDNGSTFYSTSGDYQDIATTGSPTAETALNLHSSSSALARSGVLYCPNPTLSIGPKYFHKWTDGLACRFSASTLPVNAIQVCVKAGAGIMNTGFLRVYGK